MVDRRALSLAASKRELSTIGYGLRRLVDMESAWITLFPEYGDKTSIGLGVGYTAQALEAVTRRLNEQNTIEVEYISHSAGLVDAFDDIAGERELDKVRRFVVSTTGGLMRAAQSLDAEVDSLYDEPTRWTLREVANRLADTLKMLDERRWHSGAEYLAINASLGSAIKWTPHSARPSVSDQPARPPALKRSDANTLLTPMPELLDTVDGRRRFVHFIYADIEIPAAEICARNILDYGSEMPLQFLYDMARQCSDEARHAIMAAEMLDEYGGVLGEYTHTDRVWWAYTTGANLAEKLAIEQIIGEGNGLDAAELAMAQFRERGLDSLLRYYEFLQADETVHCAFGNRWIRHLVGDDEGAFNAVIEAGLMKSGLRMPGSAPVCIPVRQAAEFSDAFIEGRLLRGPPD